MLSITSLRSQERGRTLTFGLEKSAKLYIKNEIEIPFFCPVCNFAMSTITDEESFRRVSCCRECEMEFAEKNLEKWKEGIRPSSEEVESKISEREILFTQRYINNVEK